MVWIEVIFGVLVMGMLFVILDSELSPFMDEAIPLIDSANDSFGRKSADTLTLIDNIWTYIPVMVLIGMVGGGIWSAQKRQHAGG